MDELIDTAVRLLREGRLVAFPTETVYGLGADATNAPAVARIFAAKGRPPTNPLIVHVAGVDQARRYARQWPAAAEKLAQAFWPGPLTIVVPRTDEIVPQVSAGLDTVGLRSPRHPLALELLQRFDGPVAAPSANRSNRISPTTAEHVREELGALVDLILDGGACAVGIESTVITLCTETPTVLRPGHITPAQLETIIGRVNVMAHTLSDQVAAHSPGQNPVHYSPVTPCLRFEQWSAAEGFLQARKTERIIVLALQERTLASPAHQLVLMPAEPEAYARNLYSTLRTADAENPDHILIESPPVEGQWLALRDRLGRAAKAM